MKFQELIAMLIVLVVCFLAYALGAKKFLFKHNLGRSSSIAAGTIAIDPEIKAYIDQVLSTSNCQDVPKLIDQMRDLQSKLQECNRIESDAKTFLTRSLAIQKEREQNRAEKMQLARRHELQNLERELIPVCANARRPGKSGGKSTEAPAEDSKSNVESE